MPRIKQILKYIVFAFVAFCIYLYMVASVVEPKPKDISSTLLKRYKIDKDCYKIGNNWIRKSESGLWEEYVEGDAFERGVINGKLSEELINIQEEAFNDKICKLVPSTFYRNFLKYFIGWFNRDLDDNLSEEEKLEMYGVSLSFSHKFDYVGTPYQRLMNYHAAHDIGHALQNLALVGCSSFSTWNEKSQDSQLIVGRNFDFYVGDKFAENKIVYFCKPKKGYKFMMITWGGMTGVVSGMNMEGLTITLNAAKSTIPSGSATPISILARDILQHAKNIDEAIAISKSRKAFVSESFLIGSANDNKSAIIEKTPESVDIYYSNNDEIVCTNHYQGESLRKTEVNMEQMSMSASTYRYKRINELLDRTGQNTPIATAAILRNQLGLHDTFIGWGNEKAINQLISHHSIIFEPKKRLVWVSTAPWQLGKYVAYDLNKIFKMRGLQNNTELYDSSLTIPADTFLKTKAYVDFVRFREWKEKIHEGEKVDVKQFVALNPEYYHTYVVAGNYLFEEKKFAEARGYYQLALTKEVATKTEENEIKKRIEKCLKKQN